MSITKRKKYGLVVSIIVFIVFLIIAFIVSLETNPSYNKPIYSKHIDNTYDFEIRKQFAPFNYNVDGVLSVWFTGIVITFILLYISLINKKEKNINKAQKIILATVIPTIIFVSFLATLQLLDISNLADAWFPTIVTLIFIAIFEYDLFGNKTIISLFDLKLLIKITIFCIVLFGVIGILGEIIPPFIKATNYPITKEQYDNYKGEKIDWNRVKTTEELFGEGNN